jgi:hypothetical protein
MWAADTALTFCLLQDRFILYAVDFSEEMMKLARRYSQSSAFQ